MTDAHVSRCDWQIVICPKRSCSELTDRCCDRQEFRSKVIDVPFLFGCDATCCFRLHPGLHFVVVSSRVCVCVFSLFAPKCVVTLCNSVALLRCLQKCGLAHRCFVQKVRPCPLAKVEVSQAQLITCTIQIGCHIGGWNNRITCCFRAA